MFKSLKISILSPEQILKESNGEVQKSVMLDANRIPIHGGLFCERIFGPVTDYTCSCKKFRSKQHEGIVCDRCGVTVLPSSVRRDRIGHILLDSPIPNPLFWRLRSDIHNFLPFSFSEIQGLLNYVLYYIPGRGLVSYLDYNDMRQKDSDVVAFSGGEALLHFLNAIDIGKMLEGYANQTSKTQEDEVREKLLSGFADNAIIPSWTVMSVLPVIPPELRPIVEIDTGLVYSDISKMYVKIIDMNNRLKTFKMLSAPYGQIRRLLIQLQHSVDALFINERNKKPMLSIGKVPLKSITGGLVSKEGWIRGNMLGKRVDYSGRSAIVPDPSLTPYQVRIPREMLWEMMRPMIVNRIMKSGVFGVARVKDAEDIYEKKPVEVEKFLDEIVPNQYVLLNRQPTLHRDGIQVFKPVIGEGRAIGLHPSFCPPFNADFDGDTMAVYLPLTIEAKKECEILLHQKDVLSMANGKALIAPTQEIIFGVFFATMDAEDFPVPDWVCSDQELDYYLTLEDWKYTDKIVFDGLETTIGRILFKRIVPKEAWHGINEPIDKKILYRMIEEVFEVNGVDAALQFIDAVKNFGYEVATKSGLSFSIDDFDLEGRDEIITEAEKECEKLQTRYDDGKIMEYERYNYSIDAWSKAADKLKTLILKQNTPLVWTMRSGARGKIDQVIQVSGMKGLVSEPVSGKVIEIPVKNSFRQGLTPLEYFMSVHGARKGLIDKGMKTAESGYLTRRLVDVAHNIFVVEEDCGTTRGVKRSIDDRSIIGQVISEDVVHNNGEIVAEVGTIVTAELIQKLRAIGHVMPIIRSPLTCETKNGICQKCYGWDLSIKKMITVGTPVGIIAAQSIGEPGTQMVLRSFHTGGAASLVLTESNIVAAIDGHVKLEKLTLVQRSDGKTVTLTDGKITLGDMSYDVPRSSIVGVNEDSLVKVGDLLSSYYPYNYELVANRGGVAKFIDLEIGRTVEETSDNFGRKNRQVAFRPGHAPSIQILFEGSVIDTIYIPDGAYLVINNGDVVKAGDTVARLPKSSVKAIDITSGLKDINRLFEARSPQSPNVPAVLSDINGIISIEHNKGCRFVYVNGGNNNLKEYKVGYDRLCLVNDGDWVTVGTKISEGDIDPQDILRVWGFIGAQEYMVEKIAEVYDFHGIFISKKHIEIIVRQMFSKVRITDSGSSDFITDEVTDRAIVLEANEELIKDNNSPIQYELILFGISKVAMASSSFLSAISFQNTIRLMTDAALYGRRDRLYGMKENVLVGRQIPVSILDISGVKNESIDS